MPEKCCAVILAAGEGKRMKSNRPKVLSQVLFKPMLQWVIDSAYTAEINDICVVTGHKHEDVEKYLLEHNSSKTGPKVCHTLQSERKGTGHAVMMASDFLSSHIDSNVLILNGDAPFVDSNIIKEALNDHVANGNAVTVISALLSDPTGYGRIVRDSKTKLISGIVEQKDADEKILSINEINSGAFWFKAKDLLDVLKRISNNNVQGEYYLTDAVKLLINSGKRADAYKTNNPNAVLGANDCLQLSELNRIAQNEILSKHMKDGIEIPIRSGVIIGPDVKIGNYTCILPGTILCGKTTIGSSCKVGPNSFLSSCSVGDNVILNSVQCKNCCIKSNRAIEPFSIINHNID